MEKYHSNYLYNILLSLSRNKFFYTKVELEDTFETRIYLMFIHFSILMICTKKKSEKFNQILYDNFFHNIENNLRELGLGDVSVNKKMKEFNKILYDILLKLDCVENDNERIKLNTKLIESYFPMLATEKKSKMPFFIDYFKSFSNFCFEKPLNNMLQDCINFYYGSS